MLNVTNHQESANQNHNEIPTHICQDGYYQTKQNKKNLQTRVGKNVKKFKSLYTVGANAKYCPRYCGKQCGGSLKY